jgi:hypothetical protein
MSGTFFLKKTEKVHLQFANYARRKHQERVSPIQLPYQPGRIGIEPRIEEF